MFGLFGLARSASASGCGTGHSSPIAAAEAAKAAFDRICVAVDVGLRQDAGHTRPSISREQPHPLEREGVAA